MKHFERLEAVCPYYKFEENYSGYQTIVCEGVLDGAFSLRHIYSNKRLRDEAALTLCCGEWQECPLARAIYEYKYKSDE